MPEDRERPAVVGEGVPVDPQEAPTRQARPEVLFGQISVTEGIITPNQLAEAVEAQETEGDPQPIGEILLRKGFIIPGQLRTVLEIQARRLSDCDGNTLDSLEESLFGKKVVHLGIATEQEVNAALRAQARRRESGEEVRLGQVLVDTGAMTQAQVRRILHGQQKEVLFCPECFLQYNIIGFEPGRSFHCRSCKGELRVPVPGEEAPVDPETLIYESASQKDEAEIDGTFPEYTTRPSYSRAGEIRGETFGSYRILKKVARGGMGIVYQALQTDLNRIVAIKVLVGGEASSEEELRRFHLEASAAANLNHPYIVPIHEVGEIDGRHYFTMDFVKGRTLSRMIRKGGLPIREALIVSKKVLEGLEYAHSQGIVHRDIKPANIILDQFGNPRLTDFGIVKDLLSDSKVTKTGEVMGTPAYMSPEQATGEGDIDGRADVYSLGAVLYELLTSSPPFKGENSMEVLMKCLKEEPKSPRSLNPSIHRDVETICLKALEKDPNKRYATARSMQKDIERYLNGETILARPVGWREHLWRKILRNKAVSLTAAAALVVVLGAIGFAIGAKVTDETKRLEKVLGHVREGRALMGKKRHVDAIRAFENALAIDPDRREAIHGIEDAKRGLAFEYDRLIREGNLLFDQGSFAEAEDLYMAALKIDSHGADAKAGLDRAKRGAKEEEDLVKRREESRLLLEEGRRAIRLARDSREAAPEDSRKLYVEAVRLSREAFWKDQSSEQARKALFDLLLEFAEASLDWRSFDTASSYLGEAKSMGIEGEAIGEIETRIDQERKKHEGYTDLMKTAREKISVGDFEAAIGGLLQALEIEETDEAKAALRLARHEKGLTEGDRHASEGHFKDALASYRVARANTDEPSEVEPRIERATIDLCGQLMAAANDLKTAGRGEEAEKILREVLRYDPAHRTARTMLADLQGTEQAPEGMIYVPGGEFSLAADLTGRKQIVGSFYIDRYEVTNARYREFVEAGGYGGEHRDLWGAEGRERIGEFVSLDGAPGPAGWTGGTFPEGMEDHPVTGVSWHEARAYARWRGERLPFEWEWEMSASGNGGKPRKYPWGDTAQSSAAGADGTRPVGENELDESPFGVRDLGGNVNEWTVGEDDTAVVKGGTFLFPLERYSRCSFRGLPGKGYRSEGTGFRCVREIGMEEER